MEIILAVIAICLAFSVLVLSALQMKTDEERDAEDAEFVTNYCQRKGDRT
jgi:hypothetical protein